MVRVRILVASCAAITVLAALATVSSAADTKLYATMSGKQEVPRKGDPYGAGTAVLTVKSSQVCYVFTVKKAGSTFTAGHVHTGKKGKAGPVFIPLWTKPKKLAGGKLTGCSPKVKPGDLAKLKAKPANYYVNIHNAKYPDGALRGQLSKKRS